MVCAISKCWGIKYACSMKKMMMIKKLKIRRNQPILIKKKIEQEKEKIIKWRQNMKKLKKHRFYLFILNLEKKNACILVTKYVIVIEVYGI